MYICARVIQVLISMIVKEPFYKLEIKEVDLEHVLTKSSPLFELLIVEATYKIQWE